MRRQREIFCTVWPTDNLRKRKTKGYTVRIHEFFLLQIKHDKYHYFSYTNSLLLLVNEIKQLSKLRNGKYV